MSLIGNALGFNRNIKTLECGAKRRSLHSQGLVLYNLDIQDKYRVI